MKTKPNDVAYPSHEGISEKTPGMRIDMTGGGLTKREYFAGLAMQGSICANDHSHPNWMTKENAAEHAKSAVMLADALIEELNKGSK